MPKYVTPARGMNYQFTRPFARGRGSPADDFDPSIHRYFIVAESACPQTGKFYWQCYIQYFNEVRWTSLKRYFGDDIHGGSTLHSPASHIEYTKSFGRFVEHGSALMTDPTVTITGETGPASPDGEDE